MPIGHGAKTQVFSTTISLINDTSDDFNDLVLLAVLQEAPIADVYISQIMEGRAAQTEKYYQYCKDEYFFGLPEGTTGGFDTVNEDDLLEILKVSLDDADILLHTSSVATLTPTLAILPHIMVERDYDIETNTVNNPPTNAAPEPGVGQNRVYFLRGVILDPDGVSIHIQYLAVIRDDDPLSLEIPIEYLFHETIATPDLLVIGEVFCIVKYSTVAAPDTMEWWYYNMASGVYPSLNVSYDALSEDDFFMPVIPIRYKNDDLADPLIYELTEDSQELYTTSKRALKYIGLDINALAENINANPSKADIDYAYVTHCIDPNNTKPEGIYYLGQFFHYLYNKAHFNYYHYIDDLKNNRCRRDNIFDFQDPASFPVSDILSDEARLRLSVSFSYITSSIRVGSIGAVGYGELDKYREAHKYEYLWPDLEPINTKEWDYFIRFKVQITETTYREVTVCNLIHRNNIRHGTSVITTIEDLYDSEEHNMVIPIHYGLCHSFPKPIRDIIFNQSLMIIINSEIVTSIPWYGQGWFVIVKMVVAFALAWWTGGASMKVFLASMAGQTAIGAMVILSYYIAISIALKIVFNYLAKMLGPEYAGLLAVVALVISIATYQIGGALNAGSATLGLTTSQMFLTASLSLFGASSNLAQTMVQGIQDDLVELREEYKQKQSEVDKALELLNPTFLIDPYSLISVTKHAGLIDETPGMFYHRTIHQGNIGTLVLDVPEKYHEIALTLPTTSYAI